MKRLLTCLVLTWPLFVCGCVPSLHALYSDKDVVADDGLVGTWKQDQDKSIWKFSKMRKNGRDHYRVEVDLLEDNKRKKCEFIGTLVKIKDVTYLDLYPAKPEFAKETSVFYLFHLVPAHTFSKVTRKNGKLDLNMMNPDWLGKYLTNNPQAIAHTIVDDRVVLTASTEEIQAFVDKHKDAEKAFGVEVKLEKQ